MKNEKEIKKQIICGVSMNTLTVLGVSSLSSVSRIKIVQDANTLSLQYLLDWKISLVCCTQLCSLK